MVRLYLAWDRPDRSSTDFTMPSFEAFRDRITPLLDGTGTVTAPAEPMAAALAAAELARGENALRLAGFDPARRAPSSYRGGLCPDRQGLPVHKPWIQAA